MYEQMSLFGLTKPEYHIDNKIRLIELFAGYGSQAMALKRLGADFEHYRVVEWDKYAMASYNAVHGTNFETTDISNIKGVDLGIVDRSRFTYLLTYSFPCTDISVAGRMAGMAEDSNTRSSLLWQVKRILEELNETDSLPQILLMENVPAIRQDKNIKHFQKWTAFLDSIGYSSYSADLNAADYGVAQHRERTLLVSILGDYYYSFPSPIELDTCMEDYFEELTDEMALQQVVKSEKALSLLVDLDEKGQLD